MPLHEDPDIVDLLNQLQGSPGEHAAQVALSRYRAEALASARDGADRQTKEALIDQARQRLKNALRGIVK